MIKTGSIVRPIAGRNQDRFFVVIQTDADCVLLSDGRRRKLNHPKRKKQKHLEDTGYTLDLLKLTTDKQLRKALPVWVFVRYKPSRNRKRRFFTCPRKT